MQGTIEKLKNDIDSKCDAYVNWNRVDLIKDIKPLIPDIQSFVMEFIQTADIGVDPDIKTAMNTDMLGIFDDIAKALENTDSVLMYDALKCGLAEYLKLFVPEDEDE